MSTRPLDRSRTDSGFTLPEVLITVVVLGIIMAVLGGVFSVYLRSTPTTEARAEDARSVMGLVTWLPQDVDSTPATGFDVDPSATSGCSLNPGINLLRMEWSEKIGSVTTTYIANYRHVSSATGARVVRITCSGVTSPPFASGNEQNLTSELPLLPGGWAPGDAPAAVSIIRTIPADPTSPVELVTMELTTLDGDTVRTDSASKNPAATLPSTTLPSWMPPTPTTNANVNTLPTTVNQAVTLQAEPTATTVNLIVHDDDGDPLVVALSFVPDDFLVTLVGLQMTITPEVGEIGHTHTIKYTVDDLQGDGLVEGEIEVTVVSAATPTTTTTAPPTTTTTTTTTTLPPSCMVTSSSLSRTSVKNVPAEGNGGGNVNVGVLQKAIVVSAVTNIHCSGLEIRYDSGGGNSPGFLVLSQTGTDHLERPVARPRRGLLGTLERRPAPALLPRCQWRPLRLDHPDDHLR